MNEAELPKSIHYPGSTKSFRDVKIVEETNEYFHLIGKYYPKIIEKHIDDNGVISYTYKTKKTPMNYDHKFPIDLKDHIFSEIINFL